MPVFFQHNYRLQAEKVAVMSQVSAGIAQLVERPTEKPGAILTRDRVPGAARDFLSPRVNFQCTLRTSLSDTFLQTLPDLVTPLNGALFISAQLSSDAVSASVLRKVRVLGSNIASKHVRKHDACPPRVEECSVSIQTIFGFIFAGDFGYFCDFSYFCWRGQEMPNI